MLQNLLATNKYLESVLYAGLGFLIVFLGIAFLIFIVWLAGKVITLKKNQTEKIIPKNQSTDIEPSGIEGVSEETIAVIMAALMAYYQTEQPKCDFTVRRIKRI